MSTTDERIERLKEQGWVLAHNQKERTENVTALSGESLVRPLPGLFRFERIWKSVNHSVSAETLERAISATEAEQSRIETVERWNATAPSLVD